MRLAKTLPLAALLLLISCPLYSQNPGPPSRIYITSPQPRLISGQKLQLSAVARDAAGLPRNGDNFVWISSADPILSVSSTGLVTARRLGMANITAAIGNVRGVVRLQVLPLRIDVKPAASELFVGDQLQYTAVALDINEAPIPQVPLQWRVAGANGNPTQTAGIDSTGLLTAYAVGSVTARAIFNYGVNTSQFVNQYFGLARANIKLRTNFRLTRLLSTEDVGNSFHLRPSYGEIAANDAGQVAFVGNLDGLATALLLYDAGKIQMLASAGSPGPVPGSFIFGFSGSPSISNRGEVLVRVGTRGQGSGLLLASRAGASFVLVEGQSGGGIERLQNVQISRYSLNDKGEIVFRGSFRFVGSRSWEEGVFRLTDGALQVIYSSSLPLPGLSGSIGIGTFGIDRNGVVYFTAFSSSGSSALYRQLPFSPPIKVTATGDAFAGSVVRNIFNLSVAAGGDVALALDTNNGSQYVARYAGGEPSGQPRLLPVRGIGRILSVNNNAGVLFEGDLGRGWGLYRWNNDAPVAVLSSGRLAPNGEPIRQFDAATITSKGEIYAQVRTAENEFVVIQPGGARAVLFQAGDGLDVVANLNFGSFVGGSHSGPLHLLTAAGSLFELDARGLVPRLVTGDRLPDGARFLGAGTARKNTSGDLYFVQWEGMYRLTGDRAENVMHYPIRAGDGVNVYSPWQFAVNEKGAVVWQGGTDRNHGRLYLTENGNSTLLAYSGVDPSWQTPSPAGAAFENFGELAIDEQGRVMGHGRLRNGSDGLFLYADGGWRTTVLSGVTQISGQVITFLGQPKAVGTKFYAVLSGGGGGGSILAEFRDPDWVPVVDRNEVVPGNSFINGISAYDINRRGDIAFVANLNGLTAVLLRSADGLRVMYSNNEATEAGDQFSNFIWDIYIGDDRRVFFTGLDIFDRYLLYQVEPLF